MSAGNVQLMQSDGSDVFISADEDFSESELGPSLENSLVAGSDYDIATSCDEANRDSAIAKEVDPIFFSSQHAPFSVFCALLLLWCPSSSSSNSRTAARPRPQRKVRNASSLGYFTSPIKHDASSLLHH
jgi:hypothetical protein